MKEAISFPELSAPTHCNLRRARHRQIPGRWEEMPQAWKKLPTTGPGDFTVPQGAVTITMVSHAATFTALVVEPFATSCFQRCD